MVAQFQQKPESGPVVQPLREGPCAHDAAAHDGTARASDLAPRVPLPSHGNPLHRAPAASPGPRLGFDFGRVRIHNVLQAGGATPVVQRAPVLEKRSPGELISDDDFAKDVDTALAQSKTITTYVAAKDLRKATGRFHIEFKETFEKHLAENAKAIGDTTSTAGDKDTIVKGFTDLKSGEIRLRERVANVESAVHEAVHLNSKQSSNPAVSFFQREFSHPLEEGVTQYFTNRVLAEQKIGSGSAYPDQLALAQAMVDVLNDGPVGKAYFNGDHGARDAIIAAFNKSRLNYTDFLKGLNGRDKKDWQSAATLLKRAFGAS